jgi:hypothetical protein
MPPPTNSNLYRVHPMIPPPVPNFPPPLMSSIGYFPLPPPNFRPNNLYDTPACSSVPSQRPLFQSHAHETIKPANQAIYIFYNLIFLVFRSPLMIKKERCRIGLMIMPIQKTG